MPKTATIRKITRDEWKSCATGSPAVSRTIWHIVDDATGRVIDSAKSRKQAKDRARFAGYTTE